MNCEICATPRLKPPTSGSAVLGTGPRPRTRARTGLALRFAQNGCIKVMCTGACRQTTWALHPRHEPMSSAAEALAMAFQHAQLGGLHHEGKG
jgi:hypothetical protein